MLLSELIITVSMETARETQAGEEGGGKDTWLPWRLLSQLIDGGEGVARAITHTGGFSEGACAQWWDSGESGLI